MGELLNKIFSVQSRREKEEEAWDKLSLTYLNYITDNMNVVDNFGYYDFDLYELTPNLSPFDISRAREKLFFKLDEREIFWSRCESRFKVRIFKNRVLWEKMVHGHHHSDSV